MDEIRRKYFDSFVDEWDKMFTAEDLELLEFLIDSFNIKEGSMVADLGCGTGVLFDLVRRRVGSEGMVIGIDYCSRMLRKARLNFPFDNIYTIDSDVENLPLKSDTFDYAITFAAFAHFPKPVEVMKEVSRILKKGGQFYIIHLLSSEEFKDYHHQIGGPVAEDRLPSRDEMENLFSKGNFVDIKITDHPGMYLAQGIKA